MKKTIITSTFAVLLFLGVSCGNKTTKTDATTETEQVATDGYYTCPMHPEIHEDKPGECPKCGMTLELKKDSSDSSQMEMSSDTTHMDMPTESM